MASNNDIPYTFQKVSSIIHTLSDSESDTELNLRSSPSLISNKQSASKSFTSKTKSHDSSSEDEEPTLNNKNNSYNIPERSGVKRHVESESTKPLCEYGSKCYRKNPQHFKDFRHIADLCKEPAAKISRPSCYHNFFLTKVAGINSRYNSSGTIDVKDILSSVEGCIIKSAQFNYMFDFKWLMHQYDVAFRNKPVLIVHGCQGPELSQLQRDAEEFTNITLCRAPLSIAYGTHHTKMMLLLYESGLRIVIHTANLIHQDWYQKTQGVWMSPIFPKLTDDASAEDHSATHFKHDLIQYLYAYQQRALDEWIALIKRHDLSSAGVVLIGSVPGRHTGNQKSNFGHLKLRKILEQHGPSVTDVKGWPVIGQFSSIGSLGNDKTSWLCGEWYTSLGTTKGPGASGLPSVPLLIFPSKENVRLSLEGYAAGGSLPYSINVARKQTYLNELLHQWKSEQCGRTRASPHIKTYCRTSPDFKKLAWFLLTSANLSKAAWGALEKNASQLMIRSYELGVLFIPQFLGSKDSMVDIGDDNNAFRLPYDLPLTPYRKDDRPWMWDVPYTDLPDSHGVCWKPGPHS